MSRYDFACDYLDQFYTKNPNLKAFFRKKNNSKNYLKTVWKMRNTPVLLY